LVECDGCLTPFEPALTETDGGDFTLIGFECPHCDRHYTVAVIHPDGRALAGAHAS
jgi:hypothetical protein